MTQYLHLGRTPNWIKGLRDILDDGAAVVLESAEYVGDHRPIHMLMSGRSDSTIAIVQLHPGQQFRGETTFSDVARTYEQGWDVIRLVCEMK